MAFLTVIEYLLCRFWINGGAGLAMVLLVELKISTRIQGPRFEEQQENLLTLEKANYAVP